MTVAQDRVGEEAHEGEVVAAGVEDGPPLLPPATSLRPGGEVMEEEEEEKEDHPRAEGTDPHREAEVVEAPGVVVVEEAGDQ